MEDLASDDDSEAHGRNNLALSREYSHIAKQLAPRANTRKIKGISIRVV